MLVAGYAKVKRFTDHKIQASQFLHGLPRSDGSLRTLRLGMIGTLLDGSRMSREVHVRFLREPRGCDSRGYSTAHLARKTGKPAASRRSQTIRKRLPQNSKQYGGASRRWHEPVAEVGSG